MRTKTLIVAVVAVLVLAGGTVQAITVDTVPVGNAGNAGEWSGASYGGHGPDRICGAVSYAYNIGKYEVTAGQYTAFLNAVADTDTYALYNTDMSRTDYGSGITRSGSSGSYTYSVASDFTNRPVNYVSWGDSARFANWLHNGQPTGAQGPATTEDGAYYLNGATTKEALLAVTRKANWKWAISSEDEWYKASYHDKTAGLAATYFDYPTSSNTAPGQDMTDASGNNANYWTAPYASPIDSGKYTTVAGEFQNSDSPYGTFDQGGNVWEWNEAIPYGSDRGLRGGSFNYNDHYLQAAYRYNIDPTYEIDAFGFRVSQVPEPASMALLALGGIGMLLRRRGLRRYPENPMGEGGKGMTRTIALAVFAAALGPAMSSVAWAGYYQEKLMLPSPEYVETPGEVIVYQNMVKCRQIHAIHITPQQEMVPGGRPYPTNITFDVGLELAIDGGAVYTPALAQGEAQLLFTAGGGGGSTLFEIKLDYARIFRGTLPPGVMIRQSVTLDSTGVSTGTAQSGPSGGYEMESSLDLYTEITTDEGQTWYPSIDSPPMHLTGIPEPATLSLLALGGLAVLRKRRK